MPTDASPSADGHERALRIHYLLLAHYGEPSRKNQQKPLDELILTILSQNTADVNTARAYSSLREKFPSWEDVLGANTEQIVEAIRIGGLANIKALRIQRILRHLEAERGQLDLGFLSDMPVQEARSYLTSLHGIGPKTAACVLLFSLHKPALPVDTHVHRVARRTGLVAAKTSPERTEQLLEDLLPETTYYPFHLNVIRHGRTLCLARNPKCLQCPLVEECAHVGFGTSLSDQD